MAWESIRKAGHTGRPPNLADYDEIYARFSWERARAALDGLPSGRGLDIAHEEDDYPELSTLDRCVAYLSGRS